MEDEVIHVYQRTLYGFNIFYDLEDYIVYYTIFSVLAVKYGITVYGLCLMIDHIHSLISCSNKQTFSRYISHVTLLFVKQYNSAHGRKGPLFNERFGSSVKTDLKMLRTAISYLYNNPVEKQLCSRAQNFRWNFLAYGNSQNPYSQILVKRKKSPSFLRILKEVDDRVKNGRFLTYPQVRRLLFNLEQEERNQLVDYIISKYSVIRYDLLESCYGGFESMIVAIHSNAGSEYDINEIKYVKSDREYRELYRCVHKCGFVNVSDVITLPEDQKDILYRKLFKCTSANKVQIRKFLHIASRVRD